MSFWKNIKVSVKLFYFQLMGYVFLPHFKLTSYQTYFYQVTKTTRNTLHEIFIRDTYNIADMEYELQ